MKLALVGQPNLGKTTLAHILQFQYPEKISLVPDKIEIESFFDEPYPLLSKGPKNIWMQHPQLYFYHSRKKILI